MKLQTIIMRSSLLLFAGVLAFSGMRVDAQTSANGVSAVQAPVVAARITQAIDETQLVQLKGSVHPLARPEFDQGLVSDATPMNRMLLVLQRSPEQQAALEKLMNEQQTKDSPNFHKWLTPEQFGKQLGPADGDVQAVKSWLGSHGFHDLKVGVGRTTIEFSGNVGQVRNAFRTEIHRYVVDGDARQANASDPHIPVALTPVVAGIASLHNFPSKSMRHTAGTFTRMTDGRVVPQLTGSGGSFFALGPADFAKIYNIPSTLNGSGSKIAIIGTSNIDPNDVANFRNLFGLPANPPNVVLNGPDPGINGEEGEADLDVQWAGAVAPNAQIDFVTSEATLTSDPLLLSVIFVIDNNSDDIMSLSFGNCEANLGTSGNALLNNLWEQSAAQGITVTISAGDPGSAGCDDFNKQKTATHGLAVSGFASTPFNIAVGGTDFDDVGIQGNFWSNSNAAGTRESALGYIPETTWNDSCAATATNANLNTICASPNKIVGGSGGPSGINSGAFVGYKKPAFQNGLTPADNARDIPDISLFASDGPSSNSFYLVCQADAPHQPTAPPSCASSGSFRFQGVGGTSASAPSFAGIMALIEQSERTRVPGSSGRQGNANFVLYKLAQTAGNSCNSSTQPLAPPATCVFYDVTKGNNSVPCSGGATVNCSGATNGVLVDPNNLTTPAWKAGTGYDYATGLGTVNVANLAAKWGGAVGSFKGSTASLKLNGGTAQVNITHGASVAAVITVAANPGPGTPSGDVSLLAPTAVNGSVSGNTLTSGTVSFATTSLPGGSYNVTAHYAGDVTFGPSDSNGVPVVVAKENSTLQAGIVTFDAAGNITNPNATSFIYGSGPIIRMDILNSSGSACQPLLVPVTTTGCAFDATGSVTITDNGAPLNGGSFKLNSAGHAEDQNMQLTGGAHALVANYAGDISYKPSATMNLNVNVMPTATATTLTPGANTVATNQGITLSVAIGSQSGSTVGPTGTVTFKDGATTIGTAGATPAGATASVGASATAVLNTSFTTAGTHVLTAVYAGDTNYTTSTSAAANVTVTGPQSTFTVGGSAVAVTAGMTGTSTISVTPTNNVAPGMVNVTCPAAGLPAGVTCTPNPLTINAASATAATTGGLMINVAAPATTLTASAAPAQLPLYAAGMTPRSTGKGWWMLSAGTGLAAMFLLFLPGRKRYRTALGLGLVCMLSFTLGCSSNSYGGGGGAVATITKLTVTAPTKVASGPGNTFVFSVAVTGGTPTGQVQLFDGTTALGGPVTVSGGLAPITSNGLPVGTHSISAHYLGTTSTLASQSGALNVTVTGTTTFAIMTAPAASNGSPTVSITIN